MPELNLIDFPQVVSELKSIIAEEPDRRERRSMEKLLSKLELLRKIEGKTSKAETDIKKAMSITCYGSLAYCCGLAKECFMRDGCRQALGIDDETYVGVKERMVREMLRT